MEKEINPTDGTEFVRICNPKKSEVMEVAVRERLGNLNSPVNQQEKALGSQSLPHALYIGRQSRPFGDFHPLNLWGQIFSLGSGSGVATVKSADFTVFLQGLYIGAVSKKELLHLEDNTEEKRKFSS